MLLNPTQRAVLRALGEDGISGTIAVPAAQTYTVFLEAPFPFQLTGLATQTSAGTLTANVQINGVSVAGLSAIAVTTALLRSDATQFSTTAQADTGALITIVVTAPAAAADFSYVLYYKRPANP